jgi:hypothetical protein
MYSKNQMKELAKRQAMKKLMMSSSVTVTKIIDGVETTTVVPVKVPRQRQKAKDRRTH